MIKPILYLLIFLCNYILFSQITIDNNDDIIKVNRNDNVKIAVNYAFIVPPNKASLINDQLEQLVKVKDSYTNLKKSRSEIIEELNKTDKQLRKLLNRIKKDDISIDKSLSSILQKIDASVTNLNNSNIKLKNINDSLLEEVNQLKKINSDLKKLTRGIWWNGVLDKTVMFVAGAALGLLISGI